jgi:nitroreductase
MTDESAAVDAAITSRRSLRAFLPTPVPRATAQHLLDVAARAPSGTNMQPWRAHVLAGDRLRRFCDEVEAAFLAGKQEERDYRYYPETFFEPYLARRREVGWASTPCSASAAATPTRCNASTRGTSASSTPRSA